METTRVTPNVVQEKQRVETPEELRKSWNQFARSYNLELESATLIFGMTLVNMLGINASEKTPQVILEAGCGSGKLALEILRRKSKSAKLIVSDISDTMVRFTQSRFTVLKEMISKGATGDWLSYGTLEDFTNLPQDYLPNKFKQDFPEFNLEVFQANNENLETINSESVDIYLSNLTLHLVSDADKMLREAFRVMKSGSRIALTIAGRPENSKLISIFPEAVKELGFKLPSTRSFFYLGDEKMMQEKLKSHGFKDIIMWYEFVPIPLFSGEKVLKVISEVSLYSEFVSNISSDEHEKLRSLIKSKADSYIREGKPVGMDCLLMIARKP